MSELFMSVLKCRRPLGVGGLVCEHLQVQSPACSPCREVKRWTNPAKILKLTHPGTAFRVMVPVPGDGHCVYAGTLFRRLLVLPERRSGLQVSAQAGNIFIPVR